VEVPQDRAEVRIQVLDRREVRLREQQTDERVLYEVFRLAPPAREGERGAQQVPIALEEQVFERVRPRERLKQRHVKS
jgi:hypothetical protein